MKYLIFFIESSLKVIVHASDPGVMLWKVICKDSYWANIVVEGFCSFCLKLT